MTPRPKQTNCEFEPRFPDHETVTFSSSAYNLCSHLARADCPIEGPHEISECGAFDEPREGFHP